MNSKTVTTTYNSDDDKRATRINSPEDFKFKREPWKRRKRFVLFSILHVLIFLTTYLAFYQVNDESNAIIFAVAGGLIGFMSAAFVLAIFHLYPEELTPPLELLYWRSWCDLFLGLRFMLSYQFMYSNKSQCGPAAGFLEFAEISSEMWYVCVTVDLAYSFMNPFSRYIYLLLLL